jgi:hypothetical protein
MNARPPGRGTASMRDGTEQKVKLEDSPEWQK